MSSIHEDDLVERSDSFYRAPVNKYHPENSDSFYFPAMSPAEKEAFYHPIVRATAREGKKNEPQRRCSSSDTGLETHIHGSRATRQHRKKSGGRSRSESRRHHVCRHRRGKPTANNESWIQGQVANEGTTQDLSQNSHVNHSTNTDSGYPQTVAEKVKQKFGELERLKLQYRELQNERNVLQDALAEAVAHLRETQNESTQLESLKKENRQLQEDVLLLKNTVYRLNTELEKYQTRIRALRKAQEAAGLVINEPLTKIPEIKPTPMASNMLGPLLEAYQETINEKDVQLQSTRNDLSSYAQSVQEARQENNKLRQQLEAMEQKDLELLDSQNKLVEAQKRNDSLLQTLEQERTRLHDFQQKHQKEVVVLDGRARSFEARLTECRTELLTLQGRYSVLSEQYDKLQQGADRLIPLSVHTSAVNECKRLFEELKTQYELEREKFSRKVANLEAQKPHLEAKLECHTAKKSSLEANNKALEKILNRCQEKNEDLCARLVSAYVSRDSAKRQLQKSLTLVKELVVEQERLVRALQDKQNESQSVARLGNALVNRVGSLKSQLQNVQRGAYHDIDTLEKFIRDHAEGTARSEVVHQQEVQQLRGLLRQKEQLIVRLQREKHKTEESLEVVWQAATAENPLLKDHLKDGLAIGDVAESQEIS